MAKMPRKSQKVKDKPVRYVGIDFGSWFTLLMVMTLHKVEQIMLAGSSYVPTVVFGARESGKLLIGDQALNAGIMDPDQLYLKAKRAYLTEPEKPMNESGPRPIEVLRLFFTQLMIAVGKVVPWLTSESENIKCALAYPTGLTTTQQEELRQICISAGLPVTTLLPEAVAAALAVLNDRQLQRAGIYCVFDLGDGTFDIAFVEFDGVRLNLKAGPYGDATFGAHNFTGALYEHFRQQLGLKGSIFNETTGLNPADPSVPAKLRRAHLQLWKLATAALRELSVQESTTQVYSAPNGKLHELSCSVSEFRELVAPLNRRLKDIIQSSREEAGVGSWDELDASMLVGGGSLIHGVREVVAEAVGRPADDILTTAAPLDAVALGATLFAAAEGDRNGDPVHGGLGVLVRDGDRILAKMHLGTGHVIPREGLVVESTRQFVETGGRPTVLPLEWVECKLGVQCAVSDGSVVFLDADHVNVIGNAVVDVSDLPAGTHEVRLGFEVESSGRLAFRLSVVGQNGREVSYGVIGNESGHAEVAATVSTKAVLLEDASGSMREVSESTGESKIVQLRRATAALAQNVSQFPDVDVAVVEFNDSARVVLPFGTPPDRINSAVATIKACAGTSMEIALERAEELLEPHGDCHRLIILVTDGRPANATATAEEAERIKALGIEIVTVAIGDNAATDFLAHQIASDPGSAWVGDNIGQLFQAVSKTHLFIDDSVDDEIDDDEIDDDESDDDEEENGGAQ